MALARSPVLRRLSGQLGGALVALCVINAFCSLGVLLVSLYNMELYNRVLNARNLDTLTALAAGLLIAMAVFGVLEYLRSCLYLGIADRIGRRLGLPTLLAAAAQGQAGGLPAEQALRDLGEVRLFISGTTLPMLFEAMWVPLYLVALFFMHWAYGLFAVISGILILGFNLLADLLGRQPLKEANDAAAQAFGEIAVAVRNAEAVEAMGMLPAIARRWQSSQDSMLALMHRGTRRTKALAAAARSYRLLVSAGIVTLGVVLSLRGEVTIGSLLAANILIARMILPFEQIITGWRQWMSALAAYRRIAQVLDGPAEPRRGSFALPCPEGRLVVDRLVYLPPGSDRPIIRGLSFTVEPGEVLGISGPSAAGKSTLARLILGIVEPTSGGVYLDGNNTYLWEREDFGRHVGYLPQTIALIDGTVGDNIARMRDSDPQALRAAASRARVHELVAGLPRGYETPVAEVGFALSGGQRQRIALARALYGAPRLLVLDEPNANLDQEGEQALIDAIAAAKRDRIAVVMIAHRPSVMAVADRILVLKDGAIDRIGTRGTPAARATGREVTGGRLGAVGGLA